MGKQVHGKKGGKHLALTLASVYHPFTKTGLEDIYAHFLDTLDLSLANSSSTRKSLWAQMPMLTLAGSMNCSPCQRIPYNPRTIWIIKTQLKRQRITHRLPCTLPPHDEHLLQR
jgi:hypothetical protein